MRMSHFFNNTYHLVIELVHNNNCHNNSKCWVLRPYKHTTKYNMKYSNRLLQREYAALMYVFFACHMSMKKLLFFFL
jgi:hypothetical protein